jgi:hypothetical protein
LPTVGPDHPQARNATALRDSLDSAVGAK